MPAQAPDALVYAVSENDAGYATVALENFSKSFTVSVSGYEADDVFADFPMLVRLDPESIEGFSYDDFVQSDFSDLAFFDAEGSPLAFDMDTWNTSGESLVWVKIPSFSKETVVTVAYGGLAKSDLHQKATWSGYRGVWHLNETGDGAQAISDATANAIDGASHAATESVAAGAFGGARRMAKNRGASDANGGVRFPFNEAMNYSGSGAFSLVASCWVNLDTGSNWGGALFMRKNAMDDAGWGFAYGYTDMSHFDYYFRESCDGLYTPHSDGGGGYTKYMASESIWKTTSAKEEWHKYTVVYRWDGGKIVCSQYLDGEKGSDCWLYNFIDDGTGAATDEHSYAPLSQPGDKGLALGAYIGDGKYPVLGAMDEARFRFGSTSPVREALEFSQESSKTYYAYSAVSAIEGSTVPGLIVFGEQDAATVSNDAENGKTRIAIPVNISSVAGAGGTIHILLGVAEPKDGDPAKLMREVATLGVSAAGTVQFVYDEAVLGTRIAYKATSETQIDGTHSFTSETPVQTLTLDDPAEYMWIRNAKGLWSDSANWTRTSEDDGLPRLGYPSYGSRFNIYGDSQTSEILVDANYESLASGTTLGWGGDSITFKGVVEGAAIGYPEGAGFKDGQYSKVQVTLDGVSLVCGSYHVYANSSLTMLDGASLSVRWEFLVRGENASLHVGDGCVLEQRGVDGDRFEFSGENASIAIDNGTIKANTLRIGGANDADTELEGKTPAGIFFSGAAPRLEILRYAKIHANTGADVPFEFSVPAGGYAGTPVVKTGAYNRAFIDRAAAATRGIRVSVDRANGFYAQEGIVRASQTLIDWSGTDGAGTIDEASISFSSSRRAEFRYGPDGDGAKSLLEADLASAPGLTIFVR